MGKTKKGRNQKPHKLNPTGLPSMRDFELTEGENDEYLSPVESICSSILNGSSNDEILDSLQALSHFCLQKTHYEALSSERLKIISTLLISKHGSIQNVAAGLFRNLSTISSEMCERLVEIDIFTLLTSLFSQYEPNWLPNIDARTKKLDQKSSTFLQAVNIVCNLCESTSTALDIFNETSLLQTFIRCLDYTAFGLDISVSVAQCLLVISEDNNLAWRVLINCGAEFQSLLQVQQDENYQLVLLRTVICGIMANNRQMMMQNFPIIISSLAKTVAIDHRSVLKQITSQLPLNGASETRENVAVEFVDEEMIDDSVQECSKNDDELTKDQEDELNLVRFLILSQRIAAEVLSNICAPEEDNENDDEDDDESVQDYNEGDQPNLTSDTLPVEVSEALKHGQVLENLWLRAQPLPENVKDILKQADQSLYDRVNSQRVSTLICLQNFYNWIGTEDLGDAKAIQKSWLDLGQQVFQSSEELSIIEAIVSLMRATLKHLKQSPELFTQMTESDIKLFLEGIQSCGNSELRANWLNMLGNLGCLVNEPLVKEIMFFMMEAMNAENDVWSLSEALDSFMDMFSNNDWVQIVRELNVCPKMRELEKILKTKMRQQKKELNDRYSSVLTVRNNLSRFCKYLENTQKV